MKASFLALGTSRALDWSIASTNVQASNYQGYFVDTSSGAKTIKLPSGPKLGCTIVISDGAGQAQTHNITIDRNGSLIDGLPNNKVMSSDNETKTFVYSGSLVGWKSVSTVQSAGTSLVSGDTLHATDGQGTSGKTNATYTYDFSSWKAGTANAPYSASQAMGCGRGNCLELCGGYVASNQSGGNLNEYDGSSWSSSYTMPFHAQNSASALVGSNFYIAYGYNAATKKYLQDCAYWDGAVWTSVSNGPLPARRLLDGFGISNSLYVCGGIKDDGSTKLQDTDSYDGSSWSNKTDMPGPARYQLTGGTINDVGYVSYGTDGSNRLRDCDAFDGSNWTQKTDAISPARSGPGGAMARSRIVYVGGSDGNLMQDVDAYDSSHWISLDNYPIAIAGPVAGGV